MKRYIDKEIHSIARDEMFNLFLDKIEKIYDGPTIMNPLMNHDEVLDTTNDYHLNTLGYRSSEFEKDKTDIVAAGCSISFGMGVPEDGLWPDMIKKSTGMSVANLSIPGNSTIKLVKRIIKYCEEYGDPKFVLCLFPDFFRFLFVVDNDFHKTTRSANSPKIQGLKIRNIHSDAILHKDSSVVSPAILVKTPFSIEESISPHYGIFQSLNAIFFLESYCKAKGIKLIWTTWDSTTSLVLDQLLKYKNFDLKAYVKVEELQRGMSHPNMIAENCNKHNDDKMMNYASWPLGTDLPHNNFIHPGVHFHRHIAELFESKIEY